MQFREPHRSSVIKRHVSCISECFRYNSIDDNNIVITISNSSVWSYIKQEKSLCVFTVSPQNIFATTLSCWWPNVEAIPVPVIIFSYLICNNVVNQQQLCSAPCSCVKAINDWLLKISVICSNVLYFFAKGKEVQTSEWRSWKSDECGKCLFLAAYVFLGVGLHQAPCKILQVGKQIRSLEAVE